MSVLPTPSTSSKEIAAICGDCREIVLGTVGGVPSDGAYGRRVQGNSTERRAVQTNQSSEIYRKRLIRAYTKPGDQILDPFVGSGTTVAGTQALGRRCAPVAISKASCESVRCRLAKGAARIVE